jgi:membrane fusion protein, hemolysin D
VVSPAQSLLGIVPAERHLEIDAMVLNWDIGFVHAGQDGQIKVDTVNFSRYGLLHGKVLSVSPDAITRDKPQGKTVDDNSQGAVNATSEPKGQELIYCRTRLARPRANACRRPLNQSVALPAVATDQI